MTEDTRIELLSKLITKEDISRQLTKRRRDFITESIKLSERDAYIEQGWEIYKENKSSITVMKSKSNDVDFEDSVWSLFALLGYKIMNKDRSFRLPYDKTNPALSQQIDVFAKDDETVLLIECKAASTNKRGDFKKELEAMTGKQEGFIKTIRTLFPQSKPKIKYILATKNYSITDEDLTRLKLINGVHFNEDTIDYFYALYSQLGTAARYQLLGSLFDGMDIPEMDNTVPAVEGKMGNHTYYAFSIEPEKLLKIGYVLHRNKANINMMPTYQRLIKKSRLKDIRGFIDEGGYFPNSIVISLDKKINFVRGANKHMDATSKLGTLHLPKKYRSAYIIDGQHRLYGYSESKYKESNTIPVVAFVNLSRSEQVKIFMQINENQKTVSKDLRNTLNADLLWESEDKTEQLKALCSRISIYLGEDRESALYGKISIGEDKKIITTQAIENAIRKGNFLGKVSKTKIEELGTFYIGDLDEAFEKLKRYLNEGFKYISENLKEEWEKESDGMLLINKGISGVILILSDLISHFKNLDLIDPQKDSIKKIFNEIQSYLDPIINLIKNMSDETKSELKKSYGAGGDTKYWRIFQKAIHDTYEDFRPEGLDDYWKKEAKQYNKKAYGYIEDIETYFKADFRERLEQHFGKKWFEKGVPPAIAEKAVVMQMNKNREEEDDGKHIEPWDCITIIAYRAIAMKNWREIFEKEYTRPGEEKLSGGKEEKTKWMQKLERIRNANVHEYSVSEEELAFLEELHDWLGEKKLGNA